ncbi:MAG: hypothetical protein ACJAQ3_002411, partial [Planctomycetota bacterium]
AVMHLVEVFSELLAAKVGTDVDELHSEEGTALL